MWLYLVASIAYILIGAATGIIGGMLGIGGGVISIPCLFLIFDLLGYPKAHLIHMAIGTSIAAMIFSMLSATIAQNKRGMVLWEVFKRLAPGFAIGAVLGAIIGISLSGKLLQIFFGIFLCLLAFYFLRTIKIQPGSHKLPKPFFLNIICCSLGILANLMGVGGGTMTVPLLISFNVSERFAIGTSTATTFLMTIFGSASYLIFGKGQTAEPENIGFINLPAFLILGIITFFSAPLGVKWAHELPIERLRQIFALMVFATGLTLIFS